MPIRSVATVLLPGVNPFELGVACEGFGTDRSDDGVPVYDFAVVSQFDSPVPTSNGFTLSTPHRLERADEADLVVVPACGESTEYPEPVLELLRRAVDRGAQVMSLCSGAFVLGAAGLLDGRDCTTHWRYADALARAYPSARVNPNVLYVRDGPIYTSAGTAAGLDLCLHVIRADYGELIANIVARRMVIPPHRSGGQAQFVPTVVQASDAETLAPLLDEIVRDLGSDHTIDSMAARAMMSSRTFARRFRNEVGSTPHVWLTEQRVHRACGLLESGDDSIESVAVACGFGTSAVLRHHFGRLLGTSPAAYRQSFRGKPGRSPALWSMQREVAGRSA